VGQTLDRATPLTFAICLAILTGISLLFAVAAVVVAAAVDVDVAVVVAATQQQYTERK